MEPLKPVSFGIATEAMKLGHFFRREGWPEDHRAVYLLKGTASESAYQQAKKNGQLEHIEPELFEMSESADTVRFPLMVLLTASGTEPGWVPTQRDMVTQDWVVVR